MREWYRCIFDVDNTYACVRSNEKGKRARDCRRQPEVGWSSNRRRPIYIFLWLLYTTWQREIVDRPTCVCRTNPQNPVVCFACGFYKYREKTSLSGISDDQTKKANDMLHTQHPRFFDPAGCVRYDRKDFLFFSRSLNWKCPICLAGQTAGHHLPFHLENCDPSDVGQI